MRPHDPPWYTAAVRSRSPVDRRAAFGVGSLDGVATRRDTLPAVATNALKRAIAAKRRGRRLDSSRQSLKMPMTLSIEPVGPHGGLVGAKNGRITMLNTLRTGLGSPVLLTPWGVDGSVDAVVPHGVMTFHRVTNIPELCETTRRHMGAARTAACGRRGGRDDSGGRPHRGPAAASRRETDKGGRDERTHQGVNGTKGCLGQPLHLRIRNGRVEPTSRRRETHT